jgi:hypothetical protein
MTKPLARTKFEYCRDNLGIKPHAIWAGVLEYL